MKTLLPLMSGKLALKYLDLNNVSFHATTEKKGGVRCNK